MADPWYFEEVVFDEAQAQTAELDLSAAATSLAEALELIERDIPTVVEDWAGPARHTFDAEMPGILEAGHMLVATLVAAVSGVAFAAESAGNEAALRGELREQWERDQVAGGEAPGPGSGSGG